MDATSLGVEARPRVSAICCIRCIVSLQDEYIFTVDWPTLDLGIPGLTPLSLPSFFPHVPSHLSFYPFPPFFSFPGGLHPVNQLGALGV